MNALKKLSNLFGRYMAVIVIAVAALALLAPGTVSFIKTSYVNTLLGIVMFGMGLTLKPGDFKVVFSRPKDVIIGCIAQFTLMPLLAFLLAKLFRLPPELAIGVILSWSGSIFGIKLYNTIWIILVAYMARYLSFSMKSASASLQQVNSSLEEASRACGASHTESLKDITLPLIRPAMVSGFFLIFLPAMRELTTSILLYGSYTRTLGVQIYSLRDAGMIPQASALASLAILIIIICNTIVTQITKDRKGA